MRTDSRKDRKQKPTTARSDSKGPTNLAVCQAIIHAFAWPYVATGRFLEMRDRNGSPCRQLNHAYENNGPSKGQGYCFVCASNSKVRPIPSPISPPVVCEIIMSTILCCVRQCGTIPALTIQMRRENRPPPM